MNPIEKLKNAVKGQTALEYLLIIVVAIIVVVAVFTWMQGTSSGLQNSATNIIEDQLNIII